jgi:hypothetical protein
MPLLNSPLTKEDFINSGWQNIVNSSESKDCSEYSIAFSKEAMEAIKAGKIRDQTVFEILAFVTDITIELESAGNFASQLTRLTDEHLNFLTEIVVNISDPELQARVADILWIKRHDYQMARLAITAYLRSAIELEDLWGHYFRRIRRAFELAWAINTQQIEQSEQSDPWDKLAGMFKDDPLFDEFVEDMASYRRELDTEVADREVSSAENLSA